MICVQFSSIKKMSTVSVCWENGRILSGTVTNSSISPSYIFWHIISIYSPICSFIRVYNKGYLYSRDAEVSLKVLPLHTGTEAFHLPSTHSSERLPTNLYPTLHSKDAIAPCENCVPYFRPFNGSVIFWHWARKYTATNNVIVFNYF